MKNVPQGQSVKLLATFRNFAGSVADPSTITFYLEKEATATWADYIYGTDAEVVKVSTGIYYMIVSTSAVSGKYKWRIIGTGTTPSAEQGAFYVEPLDPDDSA